MITATVMHAAVCALGATPPPPVSHQLTCGCCTAGGFNLALLLRHQRPPPAAPGQLPAPPDRRLGMICAHTQSLLGPAFELGCRPAASPVAAGGGPAVQTVLGPLSTAELGGPAVGETVILLHPPSTFRTERESVSKLTVSPWLSPATASRKAWQHVTPEFRCALGWVEQS